MACAAAAPLAVGWSSLAWEACGIAVCAVSWAVYGCTHAHSVARTPFHTTRGTMERVRRAWIGTHMKKGMVPVNTLRDWIGSAQWMGGHAMLIAVGVSGYAVSLGSSADVFLSWPFNVKHLIFVKLLAIVGLQVSAAFQPWHETAISNLVDCRLHEVLHCSRSIRSFKCLQAFNFFSFVMTVRYYGHVSFLMNTEDVHGRPVTEVRLELAICYHC